MATTWKTIVLLLASAGFVAPLAAPGAGAGSGPVVTSVLTPAIIADAPNGERLTLFLDHPGDTFSVAVKGGETRVTLFDATGAAYRTIITRGATLGAFARGLEQAQHVTLPPQAPGGASPMSVVSSGWNCFDQYCVQTTVDASAQYVKHWIDIYQWAKDADYHLQSCFNGIGGGCGDVGLYRHAYGSAFVEHIVCSTHSFAYFHDVWTVGYRDPTWFGGSNNPPTTAYTLGSSHIQATGTYNVNCNT